MHWDDIENNWIEFKSNIGLNWNKLTERQLNLISGKRERLLRYIQRQYGMSNQEAEHQVSAWQNIQINIDGHFYQSVPPSDRQTEDRQGF